MKTPTVFITQHPRMLEVLAQVKRLSSFATTVLITGESGTGKEVLARLIHEGSNRADKPFVPVNCGAIPAALIESELFGHKKGAFTDAIRDKRGLFEEADGGTIFLDEIGELPIHLQVKLLRTLQEQRIRRVGEEQEIPINVRVIAATLRDLAQDVSDGHFRGDLFYRLNVVSLHLTPLRERSSDIPILVEHILDSLSRKLKLPRRQLQPAALEALTRCSWRGNIRELENALERAMVLTQEGEITVDVLPSSVLKVSANVSGEYGTNLLGMMDEHEDLSVKRRTEELERDLIKKALLKTNGNRTKAAKILELSHRALLYKLKAYSIS